MGSIVETAAGGQESEIGSKRETFTHIGPFVLYVLFKSGAITMDLDEEYSLNMQILSQTPLRGRVRPTPKTQEGKTKDNNSLEKMLQASYTRALARFVNRGIISPKLEELAERIVVPENVHVETINEAVGEFAREGFSFPQTPAERKEKFLLRFSPKISHNIWQFVPDLQSRFGFSPEQAQEITADFVVSHELGHALEVALIIYQTQERIDYLTTYSDVFTRNSPRYHYQLTQLLLYTMATHNLSECPKQLREVFDQQEDSEIALSACERFATGFELLGLTYALEDAGVGKEATEVFVKEIRDEKNTTFNDYSRAIRMGKTKGFVLEEFSFLLTFLSGSFSRMNEDYNGLGKLLLSEANVFTSHGLGYFFPFSEIEIREYLRFAQWENLHLVRRSFSGS